MSNKVFFYKFMSQEIVTDNIKGTPESEIAEEVVNNFIGKIPLTDDEINDRAAQLQSDSQIKYGLSTKRYGLYDFYSADALSRERSGQ